MINFLIFYFVFSAAFAIGVQAYDQDRIPTQEFIMAMLLGWLLLPFGLGMLVSKLVNDKKDE
jgi:ACR3 family arsenite efflux pump ArsB